MGEPEKKSPDGPEKQEARSDLEKAKDPAHGIIARIRALEHPDRGQKDEDLDAVKTAMARQSAELERLAFRYEARGTELNRLRAQYSDLEHKFQLRPDAMRRAGEMEVTELVKKKHEVAELENSLEKARTELEKKYERLTAETKGGLSSRLAELEREYAERSAAINDREEKTALREKKLSETEKHLREQVEEARRRAIDEVSASFDHERASTEGAFQKEKSISTNEAAKWRKKAEESLAQLAEARGAAETMEKEMEAAKEAAAGSGQLGRLAEMEKTAALKRLAEWEKKSAEIEKWRAELAGREEKCRHIEEVSRREGQPLKDRLAEIADSLQREKAETEKWRRKTDEALAQASEARKRAEALEKGMEAARETSVEAGQQSRLAEMEKAACQKRLAEWEKKGAEIETWRSELAAREEKCRGAEEAARREGRTFGERQAALEKEYEEKRRALEETKARMRAEIDGLAEKYKRERR